MRPSRITPKTKMQNKLQNKIKIKTDILDLTEITNYTVDIIRVSWDARNIFMCLCLQLSSDDM